MINIRYILYYHVYIRLPLSLGTIYYHSITHNSTGIHPKPTDRDFVNFIESIITFSRPEYCA